MTPVGAQHIAECPRQIKGCELSLNSSAERWPWNDVPGRKEGSWAGKAAGSFGSLHVLQRLPTVGGSVRFEVLGALRGRSSSDLALTRPFKRKTNARIPILCHRGWKEPRESPFSGCGRGFHPPPAGVLGLSSVRKRRCFC